MIRIGVDYYPEHWDRSWWQDDVDEMSRAGINTVRLAEFAWGLLEPADGKFDFDWLDEVIALFDKKGIDIILGTPTNCAPVWLYNKHPDTRQVDRNGRPADIGIRGHRCMTSPVFGRYAKRIIEKMVKRYADHPRVIAWQLDNEPEGNHCCCPSCTKGFREFVKGKYATINNVNRAWGTDVWSGQYDSFEQILPPMNTEHSYNWLNPGYVLTYERFAASSCTAYLMFQADLIRQIKPDAVITTNACFHPKMPDFHQLFLDLDVASYDNYPEVRLPEDENELYSQSFALDMVRGYKQKNFWILEQLAGPKGCWSPISPTPLPGMIKGYAWQSIAHGADMLLLFRWRTAARGAEIFWHGLCEDKKPSGRRFEEFLDFINEAATTKIAGTTLKSDVAILYDYDQEKALRIELQSDGFTYWEQLKLWHDGFKSLGINVDIIGADANLDGYKIVVASTIYTTDEKLVARLERFVEKGGQLVVTNRSGVKNLDNERMTDKLPNAFRNVCGCCVSEYDPIGVIEQEIETLDNKRFKVTSWCDVLATNGSEVYARYADAHYKGEPAITVNAFGKGFCFYVGTVGTRSLYRQLAKELMTRAKLSYIANLPYGIEITVRENDGRKYRFIFNNTENEKTFDIEGNAFTLRPFEMKVEKTNKR